MNIRLILIVVVYVFLVTSYLEILLTRQVTITLIFFGLLFFSIYFAIRYKNYYLAIFISLISVLNILLINFVVYDLPYGYDTSIVAMWAYYTKENGSFLDSPVVNKDYPIPLTVITVTLVSILTDIETRYVTGFMGVEYIILLPTLIYLLSKRLFNNINNELYYYVYLFPLTATPLVIWGAWFIPQVHGLIVLLITMWLITKAERIRFILIPILITALILIHLSYLFLLIFLAVVLIFIKSRKIGLIGALLTSIALILLDELETVHSRLVWIFDNILPAIIGRFSEVIQLSQLDLSNSMLHVLRVIPWLPVLITALIGTIAIFCRVCEKKRVLTIGISSLILFTIGLFILINPIRQLHFHVIVDRYFVVPALVLFSVLIPVGLQILSTHKNFHKLLMAILGLVISSFVYSGVFAPSSSLTISPPHIYSLYGLISYCEADLLRNIVQYMGGSLWIDWRSAFYILSTCPECLREFRWIWYAKGEYGVNINNATLVLLGAYGLRATPHYVDQVLNERGGILLVRGSALKMIESYDYKFINEIRNLSSRHSVILDSGGFIAYKR